MSRLLPARRYKALKTRFRQLVDEMGGAEQAAARTRVGATALYNYGNLNTPDHFPPIDVILDLEADCGVPVVTRDMAAQAGYRLAENRAVETAFVDAGKLAAALSCVGRESSEVFALAARHMSDGKISPAEAIDMIRAADEGLAALAAFMALLQPIADQTQDAFAERIAAARGAVV